MQRLKVLVMAIALALLAGLIACNTTVEVQPMVESNTDANMATATFAGGCFWCIDQAFEGLEGVESVVSGYAGGHVEDPTYQQVLSGTTGHREAVQITYNPQKTSYERLLNVFWRQIDPTDPGGQFADRGEQYQTAIFYHNEAQKALAEESRDRLAESGKFGKPIVTEILPFTSFYPAEEYHQDYCRKCPVHYESYKWGSGRAPFLQQTWPEPAVAPREYQKPSDDGLRQSLTPLQYEVTQHSDTEPPFRNEYWNNKQEGIYVDVVSREPLFSSTDKFDSGSGWPSFIRPLEPEHIIEVTDSSFGMLRTEVRSKYGDSHLGHVFDDGPEPTGMRYCINSAALRFIPRSELESEGYGEYAYLFTD